MLKPVLVLVVFLAFAKANSQPATATTSSTVLLYNQPASKAVESFFQNFHAQDTVALKNQFVNGASMHSLAIKGDERTTSASTVNTFLKSIASIPANVTFEERLTSLKTVADDHIASVHTDYEFYVNGKRSHTGRNVFTMVFVDDAWKITQITDTRIY
ncbi:hypothetical protein [Nonlabens sp. YIK11]|uniref:hypothetical protein n=1 Tax=Nonlabens sp. YIK11 TaxID=1453349 RepID=UPI0006DC4027|nr:hypothetical protein [Nonlabens sp. YIK11]